MAEFMFHLELQPLNPQMVELIPKQVQYVNELFIQGTMRSYSVAGNRNTIWCVITSDTEQQAMDIVAKLPIYPFCADVAHQILMVHHSQPYELPDISLN